MKKWRVGTVSMGIFLIFLGAGFFLVQIKPDAGLALLRNCWPFILLILGVEVLFSQYLLRKHEAQLTYDVLSVFFVGLLGLISLGVYAMQAAGFWEAFSRAAAGTTYPLAYTASLRPVGAADKVIITGGFHRGEVRLFDAGGQTLSLQIEGYARRRATGNDLAAIAVLEQRGKTLLVKLRDLEPAPLAGPVADRIELFIPAGLPVEIEHPDNLDLHTAGYQGKVTGLESGP